MADMMATVWIEELEDQDTTLVLVTVAIAGSESRVYRLDPEYWAEIEPSLRDGTMLGRLLPEDLGDE